MISQLYFQLKGENTSGRHCSRQPEQAEQVIIIMVIMMMMMRKTKAMMMMMTKRVN